MSSSNYTDANLGGIKRGDSAETGDLEARPDETADNAESLTSEVPLDIGDELGELTIMDADNPDLGLTDIGEVPAEDWAADTGPTRTTEEAAANRLLRRKREV
jgi:hypothetical protein